MESDSSATANENFPLEFDFVSETSEDINLLLCFEFACSPPDRVGCLPIIWLPPTFQRPAWV